MQPRRGLRPPAVLAIMVLGTFLTTSARADIEIYRDGDRFLSIGGHTQLQYRAFDPDAGDGEDEVRFRRLRPSVTAGVAPGWEGKIQIEFGGSSSDNEVSVKDAYLRYSGFETATVTVGNQKPPYSREFMISAKRQQLVERTFAGDSNYGSPDRMTGVRVDGAAGGERVLWAASFGAASIDPDARRLDFDTPVNRDDDFNEGWLTVGRLEFHPFGRVAEAQGDLDRGPFGLALAAAAFTWSNDGDNDTYTAGGSATSTARADVDAVTGFELAAGLRGGGASVDVQYHRVDGDTVDPSFDGGLFVAGTTELEQLAVEGGWMALARRLEVVAAWESQDADGYTDTWERTSLGLNWFLDGHDLKGQLTLRTGENRNGVPGADTDEIFLQLQYVF